MKGKKIFSYAILIIVLFLFIFYIHNNKEDFNNLSIVRPGYLISLGIIAIIFAGCGGLITKFVLIPFNINLKTKEWYGLSIITTFYNLIAPFGGGIFSRAIYLKKKHDFEYSKFVSTVSGIYIINFMAASIMGLISLAGLYYYYGIFSWTLFIIFIGAFVCSFFVILFSPSLQKRDSYFLDKVRETLEGWNNIRKNKRTVSYISVLFISQIIIGTIATMLSYGAMGAQISFIEGLFLTSISTLGLIISITPSNLGVSEALAVFSALLIDINPAVSLSATLLNRVVSLVVLFILGPIFSYYLIWRKKE